MILYSKYINVINIYLLIAMKCNHDSALVKILAQLGTGFECGSKVSRIGAKVANNVPPF